MSCSNLCGHFDYRVTQNVNTKRAILLKLVSCDVVISGVMPILRT